MCKFMTAYRGRIIAFLRRYGTASVAVRTVDLNECYMLRFLEYSVQHRLFFRKKLTNRIILYCQNRYSYKLRCKKKIKYIVLSDQL